MKSVSLRNRINSQITYSNTYIIFIFQSECDNRLNKKQNISLNTTPEDLQENNLISELTTEVTNLKNERSRDQRKINELEEQMSALVHDNQSLQDKLLNITCKDEDMRSINEEFSSLDEVRSVVDQQFYIL